MVVGGYPPEADNDVELIDLSGQGRICRKPSIYPGAQRDSVGVFIQYETVVCGGYFSTADAYSAECYIYNPTDGGWTQTSFMTSARAYAATTSLDGQWWITGGGRLVPSYLSSTEIWNSDNETFTPYLDLPGPREFHNLVSLDNKRAMLIGGQENYVETFIYDDDIGSWSGGPSLSIGRSHSQAGLVKFSNGF